MSDAEPRRVLAEPDPQASADAETVMQLLMLSDRITKINEAAENLRVAYGNAGRGSSAMLDSRAFALLSAERERLRAAMVDLG